jgi:site-specific recombinase XerD
MPINVLQNLLVHALIQSTQTYTQVTEAELVRHTIQAFGRSAA